MGVLAYTHLGQSHLLSVTGGPPVVVDLPEIDFHPNIINISMGSLGELVV